MIIPLYAKDGVRINLSPANDCIRLEIGTDYAYIRPDDARRIADILNTAAEATDRQGPPG